MTEKKLTPKLAWFELCKLHAEGNKLHAEGRLIFIQAVIDHHGPKTAMQMHWTPEGCRVADREYKFEEPI
jgi:hypothetical protein